MLKAIGQLARKLFGQTVATPDPQDAQPPQAEPSPQSTIQQIDGDAIFSSVDSQELSLCKPGEGLTLWTRPDYHSINAYRQGTTGGSGRVLTMRREDNPLIAELLDQGVSVWAEVEKTGPESYSVSIHRQNEQEVEAARQAAIESMRTRISAPYRPRAEITVRLHVPIESYLEIGQVLRLRENAAEAFLSDLRSVELLSKDGKFSAITADKQDKAIRLLRALHSGYEPLITINSISRDKTFTTGNGRSGAYAVFWSMYEAEAVIVFRKMPAPK